MAKTYFMIYYLFYILVYYTLTLYNFDLFFKLIWPMNEIFHNMLLFSGGLQIETKKFRPLVSCCSILHFKGAICGLVVSILAFNPIIGGPSWTSPVILPSLWSCCWHNQTQLPHCKKYVVQTFSLWASLTIFLFWWGECVEHKNMTSICSLPLYCRKVYLAFSLGIEMAHDSRRNCYGEESEHPGRFSDATLTDSSSLVGT